MRIVGGELGGRQLLAPRGHRVRPTSDRVREAVFSALGPVDGLKVLDLYCGTGALALEALSRGAERAVLVDRDTRAGLGNIRRLGLTERARLVRARLPDWLESSAREDPDAPFDLVLCDPPYKLADRIAASLEINLGAIVTPGGRLVLESSSSLPAELGSLKLMRGRRYGGTHVAFYELGEG